MADGLRIQVRVNAVDADGIPFQQILAHDAVHSVETIEARVAVERDFGQLAFRRAQMHLSVQAEFAAEDEQIEFGFEIRVERAEIKLVEVELEVGGRRQERRGGGDLDGTVGVPAQGQFGREIGAGNIGNVFGRKRDVGEIQFCRTRKSEVFEVQRAIREIHAADRAAPLVRAVEQQGDGVGDGAEQEQNPARRVRRRLRRLGKLDDIDGIVRGAAQKKFRANGRHGIHRGLAAFQINARAGDVEERQFDDVVAVTRLAEFEIAQGERRVIHGGDAIGGAQFKAIFRVQGDGAVADFEAHQVLIQRRVFVQREIEQFQLALRTQRVEIKKAAPRNLFAGVRGAGEGVGIFVVRIGAEIFERDVERAERALERFARREIRERRRRAADVQPVNVQRRAAGTAVWARRSACWWKIWR